MTEGLPPVTARYALAGRVAIVTGASQGIGWAAARRLAQEGASLCLVAAPFDADALQQRVAEITAAGGRAIGIAADVAEPETARRAVAETLESFGRLDYLLSNAGIYYEEEVFDAPLEHLDRLLAVNVRGTYLMSVEAGRAMARSGRGSIVCTASSASILGEERMVAYNASKAAVAGLARSLAVDLAPYGIRVNAVAPGWVDTPQNWGVRDDPAVWSRHRSRVPLDRMAQPEELASVMVFLLSDEASYLTGALVLVDGGLTSGYRSSDWQAVTVKAPPRIPRKLGRGGSSTGARRVDKGR
jgi:NAD(P)-dependent dehydrogenase (short-subunit alcohol dehydrogenase family)